MTPIKYIEFAHPVPAPHKAQRDFRAKTVHRIEASDECTLYVEAGVVTLSACGVNVKVPLTNVRWFVPEEETRQAPESPEPEPSPSPKSPRRSPSKGSPKGGTRRKKPVRAATKVRRGPSKK